MTANVDHFMVSILFIVSDSYAEVSHKLNEMPCLVVVRIAMHHSKTLIMADGVGKSCSCGELTLKCINSYLTVWIITRW